MAQPSTVRVGGSQGDPEQAHCSAALLNAASPRLGERASLKDSKVESDRVKHLAFTPGLYMQMYTTHTHTIMLTSGAHTPSHKGA